jgi:hypothetical protein
VSIRISGLRQACRYYYYSEMALRSSTFLQGSDADQQCPRTTTAGKSERVGLANGQEMHDPASRWNVAPGFRSVLIGGSV